MGEKEEQEEEGVFKVEAMNEVGRWARLRNTVVGLTWEEEEEEEGYPGPLCRDNKVAPAWCSLYINGLLCTCKTHEQYEYPESLKDDLGRQHGCNRLVYCSLYLRTNIHKQDPRTVYM
jgi:hypothetical protein